MSKLGLPSLDDKLDEALKQTFPASDAFALFPEVSIGPIVLDEPTNSQPRRPTARHERASPRIAVVVTQDGELAAIDGVRRRQ